jgi:hypothetical protein
VERIVLNALANHAALPPNICAFGDSFAIVFGEADPPFSESFLPASQTSHKVAYISQGDWR